MGLLLVLIAPAAVAAPCAPAAALAGDPALVAALTELLAARGIGGAQPACPAVAVQLDRRGDALVVVGDLGEHVVAQPATAASVIESWVRADLATPLLASRPLPPEPEPATPAAPVVSAVAPPGRALPRGLQLFAAAETSFASDRSSWVGAGVGACVMLGPVCAAARFRVASVARAPESWDAGVGRHANELFFGGDVPFRVGRATLSPGFAGGIGVTHTNRRIHDGMVTIDETGGLRADVHAALSLPLRRNLALDLSIAADLTQATHVEVSAMTPVPDEPGALVRIGVGLRYGEL